MKVPYWAWAWVLIAAIASSAARAEDFIVIDSSAPDVPVGSALASGAAIAVPDKDRVVLVGASGRVVTLSGPFQGVPASAAAGPANNQVFAAVKSLVGGDRKDSSSVGVARAADVKWRADITKTLTDVTAIDASDGGEACLYDPAKAELIRKPWGGPGTVTLHALEGGASAPVQWPHSAAPLPWPATMPLADGHSYAIELQGQPVIVVTTIHLLRPDPGASDIDRVAQMAEKGCTDQARLLLSLVAQTSK